MCNLDPGFLYKQEKCPVLIGKTGHFIIFLLF